MSVRPETLAGAARAALAGRAFDDTVHEFLDQFYAGAPSGRAARIAEAPPPVGRVHDAYLAAVAEQLATDFGIDAPAWTEASFRFLDRPFFASRFESMKPRLLRESPPAFRRRLIFVSENVLDRPMRLRSGECPRA